MGMFDHVNYKALCKKCGTELKDFQTKDGECMLETLEPSEVDYFYSTCKECRTWHDFKVTRICPPCTVTNIEATIKEKGT